MQQCTDMAKECPGLDLQGQNKKEQPKQKRNPVKSDLMPRTGSSAADQAARAAAPRLDHLGTRRGLTTRTGSSGAEQEGAATTPRTGSSGEKWPDALGRTIGGGSSRRSPHLPGQESPGESGGHKRTRHEAEPRWCSGGVMFGRDAKDYAIGPRRCSAALIGRGPW